LLIALHGALLFCLWMPMPTPDRAGLPAAGEYGQTLRLRLLRSSSPAIIHPPRTVRAPRIKSRLPHAGGEAQPAGGTRGRPAAIGSASGTADEQPTGPAQVAPTPEGYVAGGRAFDQRLHAAAPAIRLPGALVPGAPHFTMVDPRTQGIAGIIHVIGGLTGAIDRHCLDVAVWDGMTTQERIAHGIDDDTLTRTAERYGCRRR
jgi:hypothetical protein